MKKFCLLFLLLPALGFAQLNSATAQSEFKKVTEVLDLSLASNGDFGTVALSFNRLHGLGKSHRFRIGYGLRFTSAFGSNTDYRTAPARLTSGSQSFAALVSEDIIANIDTVRFPKTQINSFNISINLEYALSRKFEIGINIDAIGFSFGATQTGTFIANSPVRSSLSGSAQEAKPTAFNLLLVSDSDLGSLNSEAYVRYRLNQRVSLRGGLGFQFNEYTTTRKLTFENDRFRSKNAMPMLAISYHF
ncbi:hypothetical protein GCM10028806_55600 [Spirosoma terrae]|uniref:Outer membrane beta-barrel protein n=1 Tax=Spirosoma terrae TaxID=1968276 RepID=A0A6L9LIL7_9BACT|nr:hypothetical protein [Spirosoma terrae]NDU98763.1 hypothetical protein [Spirosoma terrae]